MSLYGWARRGDEWMCSCAPLDTVDGLAWSRRVRECVLGRWLGHWVVVSTLSHGGL